MSARCIGGTGQSFTIGQVLDLARRCGGSTDPLIRQHLADFYTRLELLRYMNYRVQTALSKGRLPGPEASTTKLFVSQHMSLTGELFMELLGAHGMLAADAAPDDGIWETAFLNQWIVQTGRRHRQHSAQLPGRTGARTSTRATQR